MKSEQRAAVIQEITEALDPREVIEIYSEALLEIGAEYYAVLLLAQRGEQPRDVSIAAKAPSDWGALYLKQNFLQRDPAIRQCRRSVMPFDWASSFYNPESEFR